MRTLQRRLVRVAAAAVAVVGCGGVIVGPQSAQASIVPFLVDFNADPTGGVPTTSFTSDGFTFEFTTAGDGGDFVHTAFGGESGSGGIIATSADFDLVDTEIVSMSLTGGGVFTFDSIYLDILAGGPNTIVEGLFGAMTPFTTTTNAFPFVGTVNTGGGVLVDTVRLRSTDFNALIFDSFAGDLPMDPMVMSPEPGTLTLFVTGLLALCFMARRQRRSA